MEPLLVLKDTIAVNIINVADSRKESVQEFPTNVFDLWIAIAICIAIVVVALITAHSLLVYYNAKNRKLCEQRKDERNIETEKEWFSLRKEYHGAILKILNPKETPTQKEKSSEDTNTNTNTKELKDDAKEKYIEELRKCIEWIDKQKK